MRMSKMARRAGLELAAAVAVAGAGLAPAAPAEAQQSMYMKYDAQARALLAKMTLDEKVGQMIQPDQAFLKDPSDIEKYHLGSLLSGGGSGPKNKADYTMKGWADMVDGYQRHALNTRLAIPLLYGVDAVHGHNNIPGAVIFPHQIGLGCTRDAALIEKVQRVTAQEVRATGINWAFAPCVTVPQDIRWGRTYEGMSEDPAIVKALAGPAVRGFQGRDLSDPLAVLACAKHFIGDGGTTFGTARGGDGHALLDQGDTQVDEATLRRVHLPGYLTALQAGVGTIMPSYSSWNGAKCSSLKPLLTDLLKKELGFQGFLISDYNAIDQLGPDYKEDVAIAVNAGMDMIMLTDRYPVLFQDLKELVSEGKIPVSRIDDAVVRILRVKYAMGLMDPARKPFADAKMQAEFGSDAHRQVARQAVRESLVLLKNEGKVLPLSKRAPSIFVAGRGADDLGMQCGGWTISWQGAAGQPIPGGTSILAAIKRTVAPDTQVKYAADGSGAAGASVAVVVVGEEPYAEFMGDRREPALSDADRALVARVKAAGVPVVVVVLSGRPLVLGDALQQADGLLAAWLPGSEGAGVADVLFGDYRPTGKLSFSWPRAVSQLPLNANHGGAYDPLFKVGFGLTYSR